MHKASQENHIILTVDLEDWFQVENLRKACPSEMWDSYELRVESNTHRLMDLFDRHGVRATFFVLGWIAKRSPRLIQEVHSRGHEVASHGYGHQLSYKLSKRELADDLYRSKTILEDIIGAPLYGYRAPCFSVTDEVVELIREFGYRYDSSLNDASLSMRYGKSNGIFRSCEHGLMRAPNGIIEIPINNFKIGQLSIPWGGGGYFRLWPQSLFRRGVRHILSSGKPYVFFFHPWEADPLQPRIKNIGFLNGFRHYLHISSAFKRLDELILSFKDCFIISCSDYLKSKGLLIGA